jgi:hypothetical protein
MMIVCGSIYHTARFSPNLRHMIDMHRLLVAVLCCSAAHAAQIGGVVLDAATGRPLARSLVTLRPVDGTDGKALSTRANREGQFRFPPQNAGMYLVAASRDGFAPFQYGQKDSKSAGKPMAVEQEGTLFLDIRLHRYGAISGAILDENEIGIPDQKVIAYPARQPLEIAASAITDDRGIYRIHGLDPGVYFVRSAAKKLEDDSGLLPTFHKETNAVDQAITVEVDLDQQMDDVNIRPLPGKLFRVTGKIASFPPVPTIVTLISDVGRVRTQAGLSFAFDQVAPGSYELIAEGEDPGGRGTLAHYREMSVDSDVELQVQLTRSRETEFRMEDEKGNRLDLATARLMARRKTLDSGGRAEVLKLVNGRAELAPGRWEMSLIPPSSYYVSAFSGPGLRDSEHGRADGWNEIVLRDFSPVFIKLSSHPAAIHGRVTGSGQDAALGAPVYLEAFDQASGKRLIDLRTVRTDLRGQYRFRSLAPGVYRILSTFEFDKPDSQTMEASGARSLTLSEGDDIAQDLELYVR